MLHGQVQYYGTERERRTYLFTKCLQLFYLKSQGEGEISLIPVFRSKYGLARKEKKGE